MFDHRGVSLPALAPTSDPLAVVAQLRQKVAALEGGPTRLTLPVHPSLQGVVQLRAGGSYAVDSARLALTMLAGASAAGEWAAVVGWPDLGVEAAVELGVEPSRTVLVPEPGDLWLEATAALVDVVRVVLLRPRGPVAPRAASVLDARLRKRSAVLVVWGEWPGVEARLSVEGARWTGLERGDGRLRERRAQVVVRRGAAPPRSAELRTAP